MPFYKNLKEDGIILWFAGDSTKVPKATIKAAKEFCYTGSVVVPVSIYNVKLSCSKKQLSD